MRSDPWLLRRARLERRQELLMDVVEAAVRHDDDEIAVRRVPRDGPHDIRGIGDVPRILTLPPADP